MKEKMAVHEKIPNLTRELIKSLLLLIIAVIVLMAFGCEKGKPSDGKDDRGALISKHNGRS